MLFTADHGNDPTWRGTDHTRERVPVLATGAGSGRIGQVAFADVGASLAAHLGVPAAAAGAQFPVSKGHHEEDRAAPPPRGRRAAGLRPRPREGEERGHLAASSPPTAATPTRDFWHFLQVYEAATSVLTTPDDYARLTRAVLAESAAAGVVYSETFLSPDFCGGRDVGAWREYLHAIREAADAAERAGRHHAARHRHLHPPFRPREGARNRALRGRDGGRLDRRLRHRGRREGRAAAATSPVPSTWRARPGCG